MERYIMPGFLWCALTVALWAVLMWADPLARMVQ